MRSVGHRAIPAVNHPGGGGRRAAGYPRPVEPDVHETPPGPSRWRLQGGADLRALPLALARFHRATDDGRTVHLTLPHGLGAPRAADLVVGAGFTLLAPPEPAAGGVRATAVRSHTLADTVGPGMTLLVCGNNPSPASAQAGVGYARPGNRFWPAALAAGVVPADRDALAALGAGVGMTDLVKRPTRTAAEVTDAECAEGFARVERLAAWLAPGAVCFVGLSGWRAVVDPRAVAGPQPVTVGGRPAYLMPSTSGLNAHATVVSLAGHLAAAAALGRAGQPGTSTGS